MRAFVAFAFVAYVVASYGLGQALGLFASPDRALGAFAVWASITWLVVASYREASRV